MDWFTGDPHLDHKNIMQYGNRPFNSNEEMQEYLIDGWNGMCGRKDNLYILGDICFYKDTIHLFKKVKCKVHVIIGNHDHNQIKKNHGGYFESVSMAKEIKRNHQRYFLGHTPSRTWPGCQWGSYHIHAHCHNNMISLNLSMDCGCDTRTDLMPYSLDEINEWMKTKEDMMKEFGRAEWKEDKGKYYYYQDDVQYLLDQLKYK